MKILLLLIIILSFGLTEIYADHPDAVIVTLDKDSYEYGDTVFGTAQLIEPWASFEWNYKWNEIPSDSELWETIPEDPLINRGDIFGQPTQYSELSETGVYTFNFILLSPDLETGIYTHTPLFTTYTPVIIGDQDMHMETYIRHYGKSFDLILNTDLQTATAQNMQDIKHTNATTQTNILSITNNTAMMYDTHDEMQLMESNRYDEMQTMRMYNEQRDQLIDRLNDIVEVQNIFIYILYDVMELDMEETIEGLLPVIDDFTYIANGDNSITLYWFIESGQPITYYDITYRTEHHEDDTHREWFEIIINDGTILEYTITDLENTEYEFKFGASNMYGKSEFIEFFITP